MALWVLWVAAACGQDGIDAIATLATGTYSAKRLVSTLRSPHRGAWTGPVYVLTDRPWLGRHMNATAIRIRVTGERMVTKWHKTQLFHLLPSELNTVLYLDADVEVQRTVALFAANSLRLWQTRPCNASMFEERWYTRRRYGAFNSGIALYHRTRSRVLLSRWSELLLSGRYRRDQLALDKARSDTKAAVCKLPISHLNYAADAVSRFVSSLGVFSDRATFRHLTGHKSLVTMETSL